jgi:hypothetical protein
MSHPLRQVGSARDAEAEIAFALDLVHQIDFPAQIALARAFAGVGVVGPAPAIVGCVGHRLAIFRERQSGGAPPGSAVVEHADLGKFALAKLRCRETRQHAIG